MAIFDSFVKPVLDSVTTMIGQFHMSPEEKAQATQAISDAAEKAKAAADDYEVQLNAIAGQNIRADAQNGDKYTSRARPSFMYVIIAVFAFNYIGIPLAEIFGSKVQPIELPGDLLTLFGVCVTGYVFARTAEKVTALPGDSQIKLPFGLGSIGNNAPGAQK